MLQVTTQEDRNLGYLSALGSVFIAFVSSFRLEANVGFFAAIFGNRGRPNQYSELLHPHAPQFRDAYTRTKQGVFRSNYENLCRIWESARALQFMDSSDTVIKDLSTFHRKLPDLRCSDQVCGVLVFLTPRSSLKMYPSKIRSFDFQKITAK